MMRTTLALAAVALALAACNKPSSNRSVVITAPGASGGTVVIGGRAPANLPSYVPIYPGAKVTASTSTPKGGVLVLETNAPPETVLDFYKKSAAAAGLTAGLDSWALGGDTAHTGAHVVMFNGAGNSQKSLSASVETKDGVTKVGLIYGAS